MVVLKEIKQVKAGFPWLASACEPSSRSLSPSTATFAGIGSFLRFGFCGLLCGGLCSGGGRAAARVMLVWMLVLACSGVRGGW